MRLRGNLVQQLGTSNFLISSYIREHPHKLTFSDSGVDAYQKYVDIAVVNGMRIATVFRDVASIPTMHRGMSVIGGDNSDIRHLEDKGIVVALYAKGKAKLDDTGFVFDAPRKVISIAAA